ncbi:MAG: DUF881 domain-containing protein [Bacillota bacterium]
MRTRDGQLAIALACVVLGLMLAMQFRVQQNIRQTTLPNPRFEEVTQRLRETEQERDRFRAELNDVRGRLAEALSGQGAVEALRKEAAELRLVLGLTAVKGPGLVVTLDDSQTTARPGQGPEVFLIHDDDVLRVVNELRAAGAEAISINDQRLVAMSEIRCAGPTISINNTRTAPPIKIHVLGPPETMEAALKMRGGVIDTLTYWGIQVSIRREAELTVPAYTGSLKFIYGTLKEEVGP